MDNSYQGVQFTQDQSNILNNDLASIDAAINRVNNAQAAYNSSASNYNSRVELSCGERKVGNYAAYDSCMKTRADDMAYFSQQMGQYQGELDAASLALSIARQNYNDDLSSIQNAIKLSIQASVATTTANTQGAQNQVSILQNNPAVLTEKLRTQALIDSQKRQQNVKIVGFIVLAAVVILIGWYVIKKLL